ncbi:hypothetical protein [Nostoc sp.]|uniref:hypothetical protein n=1 Tax=Nostoc sp. TaxID=1180 RepID=UPI002FF61C3E
MCIQRQHKIWGLISCQPKGNVRPQFVIRKSNTKGKLATRAIPVIEDLRRLLVEYYPMAEDVYHFDGILAPTGDSIDNAAKSLSLLLRY